MMRSGVKRSILGVLLVTGLAAGPAHAAAPATKPGSLPAAGIDLSEVYRSYQHCSTFAVYQPTLPAGYRLFGGAPQSCPDTPPEGRISVDYTGNKGSFTLLEDGADTKTIAWAVRTNGWRTARNVVATVDLSSGPATIYANCADNRKRCRTSDITRYGGGLVVTLPGNGNLTATTVLLDLPERFGGKPTMGMKGLLSLAEGLQLAARPSADSFSYYITDSNSRPARWDRCTPIRYAVNLASIPPDTTNALEIIQRAISEISTASGFTFQYVGDTSIIPNTSQSPEWMTDQADLFIGFADPTSVPRLAGAVAGTTQLRTARTADGSLRITGSGVAIDGTEQLSLGFRSYGLGQIVLHELGHVLNLGHTDDPEQLMYPNVSYPTPNHLQPGDITGLTQLAALPCFT